MTHSRKWLWLPLVAVAAAASWYATHSSVQSALTVSGNVEVRQVNLAFKVPGRIQTLAVDEGSAIEAGQTLGQLDPSYFREELRLAEARVAVQQSVLNKLLHGSRPEEKAQAAANAQDRAAAQRLAQQQYQRYQALLDKGFISRQALDSYATTQQQTMAQLEASRQSQRLIDRGPRQEDIDAAQAQLAAEQAALEQVLHRLQDSQLVAPAKGIVLTRAREAGAIVRDGETIFTLALTEPVWIRAYVAETELSRLRPGQKVTVQTDSSTGRNTGESFEGTLGFIASSAEFTPKSVETRELRTSLVYRIRVVIDKPSPALRQGMPVTLVIPAPSAQ